ncbi:MAG: type 1 glutamine amidotransferase [Candidatus Methylomirabilis oxygeniifera]|uniref:Glutamine amidotransferase, class I n=1 Tax=Methylomirabilis oxygeniifera TaxID=671143 RepID=D5ML21_METO1|nr:MAG: type 1 glutamine amidotransferase [Candidatus Methylomirabilis oxyfera]CBE69863.1 Glutamine amidotransferase, class I [Candidatus Methylomirabilis oxyfera]
MKPLLVFQHIGCETPGIFLDLLQTQQRPVETVRLYEGDRPPKDLSPFSGLLVMGGPMSVNDEADYPWLREEDRLLKEALELDFPTLGICLGSQLIAKAAGGTIRQGPCKEIGWYPIQLTTAARHDRLFGGFHESVEVFEWHGEYFDTPPGAVNLARSALYECQAFSIDRNVYGLLFHLEVTSSMVSDWVRIFAQELDGVKDYIRPDTILEQLPSRIDALNRRARILFAHFCENLR